jgi:hypothetical protein
VPQGIVRTIRVGNALGGEPCGTPVGDSWLHDGKQQCGRLWLDLHDGRSIELQIHRHGGDEQWWYLIRVPQPVLMTVEVVSTLEWEDQRVAIAAAMAAFASIDMGRPPNSADANFPDGRRRAVVVHRPGGAN